MKKILICAGMRPDVVLMQGDTTTVMAPSLCAFFREIPKGYVEAGLRNFNRRAPFPEELNRRVAGIVADLHFCPTEQSRSNLLREGTPKASITVSGNTAIDALLHTVERVRAKSRPLLPEIEEDLAAGRPLALITGHRRESFGGGQASRRIAAILKGADPVR